MTPEHQGDNLQRLRAGDDAVLGELFADYRERLRRIVQFRLDYRLRGRIAESDVLQDVFIRASTRLNHYRQKESMPFLVWLRLLVRQQLVDVHRRHLGAERRAADVEISLDHPISGDTSQALAAHLAGRLTSVSQAIDRAEKISLLEKALNGMNEVDREVIALRHFEELSSAETANVLGIERAAASKRYVRAMARLEQILQAIPDFQSE